jgi:hypothetical protein
MFGIKSDLRFSIRVDLQLQLQLEVIKLKLKLKLKIESDKRSETGFVNFMKFQVRVSTFASILSTIRRS